MRRMSNKVGIGIVGFGYMGNVHYEITRNRDDVDVIGIYDIDEQKRNHASEMGLGVYSNMNELLHDENIDLVIVATPNDKHAEICMEALKSKKNVLCEKPAVMNLAEMKAVIDCAKENGCLFTTHHNRRWDKDYLVVKKALNEKVIGNPTTIVSQTFGQRGICFGWRAIPENGGGMLYDWGIHLIDQMLTLFPDNKVTGVYCRLRNILTPEVDDYFELELEFDNEIVSHISVGTFALQDTPRWFVFGDEGTLRLDDFSGEVGGIRRMIHDENGLERIKSYKQKGGHLGPSRTMAPLAKENIEEIDLPMIEIKGNEFYDNLVKAIHGECTQIVTHEEMIRDFEIMDAAFNSAKTKSRMNVSI